MPILLTGSRSADFGIPATLAGILGGMVFFPPASWPLFVGAGICFFWLKKESLVEDKRLLNRIQLFGLTIYTWQRLEFKSEGLISVSPRNSNDVGKWAKYEIRYLIPEAKEKETTLIVLPGIEKSIKLAQQIAESTGLPFRSEIQASSSAKSLAAQGQSGKESSSLEEVQDVF